MYWGSTIDTKRLFFFFYVGQIFWVWMWLELGGLVLIVTESTGNPEWSELTLVFIPFS